MRSIPHVRQLQAKAAALLILEGRLHPHAPAIAIQIVPSGPFVGNDHQRGVVADLPGGRQPGLALVRFPEPDPSLPVLSRLRQDGLERLPDGLALRIALRGIIAFVQFDAQEVMPARALTEQYQLLTREPTVR